MALRAKSNRPWRFQIPKIRFASSTDTPNEYSPVATYYLILVPSLILGLFGLLMAFSASAVTNIASGVNPYVPFLKTVGIAVLALIVASISVMLRPSTWERLAPSMFLVGLLLQLSLLVVGLGAGGNTNWLPIPGTGQAIQPSEFLKLATALMLGRTLSQQAINVTNARDVFWAGLFPSVLAMGAVMVGGDMGTMLIFVGLAFGAMWVAGVPGRWFGLMAIAGGAASIVMVVMSPSRTRRVLESLPGFGSPPDVSSPTQTAHGLWALGSGGLTGLGPGASREKWNYLQEAHTDFILAIVGEEFGLIGSLTVLTLLALLIYGSLRLSARAKSRFISISAGGIGSWLAVQGLVNVGAVTGLAPVIGVPFPLISYGGSSFLFTAMAIGVLLSFARTEAGMRHTGRLSPETGGRDPRRGPAPRTVPSVRRRLRKPSKGEKS